jgi:phosphoribosyl 1,2-cyclic phosphodiesterase
MLRQRNGTLIGHASIATQLDWCKKARVRRAIFTHCGSAIIRSNAGEVSALVRQLGLERDIDGCPTSSAGGWGWCPANRA